MTSMARLITAAARTGRSQRKRPAPAVKRYALMSDCIDTGLSWAIAAAYKYDSAPKSERALREHAERMHSELMNAICEYFDFDG